MKLKEIQKRFSCYHFNNSKTKQAQKDIGEYFLYSFDDVEVDYKSTDELLNAIFKPSENEIKKHNLFNRDLIRLYQCKKLSEGGCLYIYTDELRNILYTENAIKVNTRKSDGYCRLDDYVIADQAKALYHALKIIDKIL